ncbi:MAG: hypothetical protein IPK82_19155 [Polyangiaceae bacterium]|nr:hypothetical protein [Polyangiaceae bacterium]
MNRRLAFAAVFSAFATPVLGLLGCGGDVVVQQTGGTAGSGGATGTTYTDTFAPPSKTNKVDVLLAIDNSRAMGDKQTILSLAVPDLVTRLVNPPCLDGSGNLASVPTGPLEACPPGTFREFNPILDIHIGIVSSSLGGHGSDACAVSPPGKESNNDRGHLLARKDPAFPEEVETYQGLRFLAWDPAQTLSPPGEADLNADSGSDSNATALLPQLTDMVLGVGQIGCGYESQLESWYRFLVDPAPYQEIVINDKNQIEKVGVDTLLLDQRKTFLRPDSALLIVMLSDENDCSIREYGQFFYAAQLKGTNGSPFHLPKARAICETDPNSDCCFSCGQKGPTDQNGNQICPDDPSCKDANGKTIYLNDLNDNISLRCHDQKRRFGIDFLYPIDRYVDALKETAVTTASGEVVPNPIFTDLVLGDSLTDVRSPDLVFLVGIVGVPWQDIARVNSAGLPNLNDGINEQGKEKGGYKSPGQLSATLPGKTFSTWDVILGDFDNYGNPLDPLMIAGWQPRTGTNPITGDVLTSSSLPLSNPINGHEWTIPKQDDLQFACIFPRVKVDTDGQIVSDVADCTNPALAACECSAGTDSPLCEVDPSTGKTTLQVRAKAYPGLRHLAVLKNLNSQAIVASACPAQLDDTSQLSFGYRPAMASAVERMSLHFK